MLKKVTLGQFFPGNTVVHKLDPRTKLILTVFYIVALFSANNLYGHMLMLIALLLSLYLSKIQPLMLLKGIRPVIILILITAIINLLATPGDAVVEFWRISISREGIIASIFMASRLIMLIAGTFLLTYTTSPLTLTDGLERLFSPLAAIKVPVHEMAMMMSIALRFIPTIIEETDKIMSAQKARGANLEVGSILKRMKAIVPIIIPLFVSAFRRADELAIAMESRCYHGGKGRTRMTVLRIAAMDYAALLLGALVLLAVILLRGV